MIDGLSLGLQDGIEEEARGEGPTGERIRRSCMSRGADTAEYMLSESTEFARRNVPPEITVIIVR